MFVCLLTPPPPSGGGSDGKEEERKGKGKGKECNTLNNIITNYIYCAHLWPDATEPCMLSTKQSWQKYTFPILGLHTLIQMLMEGFSHIPAIPRGQTHLNMQHKKVFSLEWQFF